jgi:hypothetical protein
MRYAPAPKCPTHRVFMRFRSGTFPNRFYLCPQCRDHWREDGQRNGQVTIIRAFAPPVTEFVPVRSSAVQESAGRCSRSHVGPGTMLLAAIGGLALLSLLLGSSSDQSS